MLEARAAATTNRRGCRLVAGQRLADGDDAAPMLSSWLVTCTSARFTHELSTVFLPSALSPKREAQSSFSLSC